jgi:hypothetical protein
MMEAVSLPETSVSTRLHGATAQKSTRRRENVISRLVVCFMKCMLTGVLVSFIEHDSASRSRIVPVLQILDNNIRLEAFTAK